MKTYIFTGFYHQSLHCQTLPSLSLYGERAATPADNAARSKKKKKTANCLIMYLFVVLSAERRKRGRDREVLFLSCPWLHCLSLVRCVRLTAFFFFHPTRHSEKIWFAFFPLSPSLWHYSYLNINSNASSLAHTLSHIDICIWSLLLAMHALLYCVSFNRCKIQYCNLCIQGPKKPIDCSVAHFIV